MRNLACICNDVVINSKNNILELGSGISTIILARLLKKNNLNAKITSIDESLEWINILKNILQNEDLLKYVDFLYIPTVKSLEVDLTYKYQEEVISNLLKNQKFDLILIDGPKAWPHGKKMSRASNSKIIMNHLENNFSIFIDNANRVGEKLLINEVQNHLNIKPTYIDKTFAVFSNLDSFDFII
jgi:predicted O-methyltransferase YrrM